MNELYEELETPKGERNMYRTANAKDFTKNNHIKEEQRVVLRDLDGIMGRWKGYFDKQLNGENHRFVFDDGLPNDGLPQGIGRNKVRVTLSRMKKGETTEMDGIPEACGCVWEKMGFMCYQYDAKCIRAGEYINGVE